MCSGLRFEEAVKTESKGEQSCMLPFLSSDESFGIETAKQLGRPKKTRKSNISQGKALDF